VRLLVAASHAKLGGPCPQCGMDIGKFQPIFKYATDGETTRPGNGPGLWLCKWCHDRIQADPELIAALPEVELWECAGCLRMSNPVVIEDGHVRCIGCHEKERKAL